MLEKATIAITFLGAIAILCIIYKIDGTVIISTAALIAGLGGYASTKP